MTFLFRADSSDIIGSGHIMRCLALAGEVAKRGNRVIFISRKFKGNINNVIKDRGYTCLELEDIQKDLSQDPSGWLGVSQEEDAEDCKRVLVGAERTVDWLIVDHYGIDANWHRAMRDKCAHICVIDDLGVSRKDCDMLIDQSLHNSSHQRHLSTTPPHSLLALGTKYALLSPEFTHHRRDSLARKRWPVKNLLVSMGGVDLSNDTEKVLHAIQRSAFSEEHIDIVVGQGNTNKEAIHNLSKSFKNARMHVQTTKMAELMSCADFAFLAGGVTSWEKCTMGLPSCVTIQADNQTAIATELEQKNAHILMGKSASLGPEEYTQVLESLTEQKIETISKSCRQICDGSGVEKIYELMRTFKEISLRLATIEDAKDIYEWRLDPETMRQSFSEAPPSYDAHKNWLQEALVDEVIFIGYEAEETFGVVRFRPFEKGVLVSINTNPTCRGQRVGSRLLSLACHTYLTNEPGSRLIAEIKPDNHASIACFEKCQFTLEDKTKSKLIYTRGQ